MAHVTNDELVREYVLSLCEGSSPKNKHAGTLRVTKTNQLIYHRRGGTRSRPWGPVTLAEYSEQHRLFILNGDGFTDGRATVWQNLVRELIQTLVQAESGQTPSQPRWEIRNMLRRGETANERRYVLAPFAALNSSGIDKHTIKPIHVQDDEWENLFHPIELPDAISGSVAPEGNLPKGWVETTASGAATRTFEVLHKGNRFRKETTRKTTYINVETGERKTWLHPTEDRRPWNHVVEHYWRQGWAVWGVPSESGDPASWHPAVRRSQAGQRGPGRVRDVGDTEVTPMVDTWGWVERVHHLGASVFSAHVNGNGRRHRFISAFDELERVQRMYYLARLPDTAKPATYREAVLALAPPIVHQAWAKGTPVHRQGDIFAIETNLTDEQVYDGATARVRREVVLFNLDAAAMAKKIVNNTPIPEPAKGEVRERTDCLCGCGHRRWVGSGPKARRALSIYRTGHTATEVVVTSRGTFVRGTIHHDPFIEEPGRRREHTDVKLGEKWHLAVRNTVPRQRRRNNNNGNTEGA